MKSNAYHNLSGDQQATKLHIQSQPAHSLYMHVSYKVDPPSFCPLPHRCLMAWTTSSLPLALPLAPVAAAEPPCEPNLDPAFAPNRVAPYVVVEGEPRWEKSAWKRRGIARGFGRRRAVGAWSGRYVEQNHLRPS